MLITLPLIHGSQKRPRPALQERRAVRASYWWAVPRESVPSGDWSDPGTQSLHDCLQQPLRASVGKLSSQRRCVCPPLLPAGMGDQQAPAVLQPGAWQGLCWPSLPARGSECPMFPLFSIWNKPSRLRLPPWPRRRLKTQCHPRRGGRLTFGTATHPETGASASQANWFMGNINYHVAH